MNIINTIKTSIFRIYIRLKEKKYHNRLRYLLLNKRAKDLVVVFSGFPSDNRPRYNYIKTLRMIRSKASLFILDDFGYKGSYYWFENGTDAPKRLVEGLLSKVIKQRDYEHVYMIGSSKGGTCAIYYGLQFGANAVYSGANQYYVGKYLNVPERKQIFDAMTGGGDDDLWNNIMDNMVRQHFELYSGSKCHINILYSKNEHTYIDDIKGMMEDMDKYGISYSEKLEFFKDHGEVGYYFIPWIKEVLN